MGRRRFRIHSAFEQDGYRVAVPEWFSDAPPAEGSPEAAELPTLAKEVLELTAKLTDSLRFALVRRRPCVGTCFAFTPVPLRAVPVRPGSLGNATVS